MTITVSAFSHRISFETDVTGKQAPLLCIVLWAHQLTNSPGSPFRNSPDFHSWGAAYTRVARRPVYV